MKATADNLGKYITLGRTNNALNFENTRNISLAFRAVPSDLGDEK